VSDSARSFKVVVSKTGESLMVIIAGGAWTAEALNRLIRNGMNATVLDQRSELVNKALVDTDLPYRKSGKTK
jgi:hypothetical protein